VDRALVTGIALAVGLTLALMMVLARLISALRRSVKEGFSRLGSILELERSRIAVHRDRRDRNDAAYRGLMLTKLDEISRLVSALGCDLSASLKLEEGQVLTPSAQDAPPYDEATTFQKQPKPDLPHCQAVSEEAASDQLMAESVSEVGEAALRLLERDGRTSGIASLEGLNKWLSANWNGFMAEALSNQDKAWLLAVISRSKGNRGIVIPALDTVIGAGVVSDWFDCRGYYGTRPLERQHVIELAEAVREEEGKPWRVGKKGLLRLDTGGGA